jgi:hypothetical protein
VHADAALSPRDAPWNVVHRSIVSAPDYQIVVRVAELAHRATLPFGVAGALADPLVAGDVVATNVRPVTFDGRRAYDYDAAGTRPLRGRIFRRGSRVYIVTVRSAGAAPVFDALMRSFRAAA